MLLIARFAILSIRLAFVSPLDSEECADLDGTYIYPNSGPAQCVLVTEDDDVPNGTIL